MLWKVLDYGAIETIDMSRFSSEPDVFILTKPKRCLGMRHKYANREHKEKLYYTAEDVAIFGFFTR